MIYPLVYRIVNQNPGIAMDTIVQIAQNYMSPLQRSEVKKVINSMDALVNINNVLVKMPHFLKIFNPLY